MDGVRLGINLWSQASDWPSFLEAAQRADRLGYDHLWTWDHLLAIFGDPDQPIFEGYTALAALAQATERVQLGLFVGANTFRNPGLAVKSVTTIDHISGGRAIMGLGGAWFGAEHDAFGLDFGAGFGERLDWLAEAVGAARVAARRRRGHEPARGSVRLRPPADPARRRSRPTCRSWSAAPASGRRCASSPSTPTCGTSSGCRTSWSTRTRSCEPTAPTSGAIRPRSSGPSAARSPSAGPRPRPNASGDPCSSTTGRTLERVEGDHTFWTGTPEQIAETMLAYRRIGFHTFIVELAAPYDVETMETPHPRRQADGRRRDATDRRRLTRPTDPIRPLRTPGRSPAGASPPAAA